jgi:tripartite ATP-independent transporter DctM subunit
MLERRYAPHFAAGCIAAGGTLGSLVPPSVILIIYAVMAEEFIITLFIAAIIPAIISIASYFAAISIYLRINPSAGPSGPRMAWPERIRTILRCWGVIFILLVVVGGIYGGIFTVTEAAAFGTVLCFLFALGRRKLTRENFWEALTGTALSASMIYVIIIGANVMTYFVTVTHMPDNVINLISGLQLPTFAVLAILLIVYLLLGSIFDTVAAMVITLPFVLPLITGMGYSPIWWGIVNVVVIEIGMITPPIGLNVFILHGVAPDLPLSQIFRGIVPFLFADITRLIILVAFPVLILWLPALLQ